MLVLGMNTYETIEIGPDVVLTLVKGGKYPRIGIAAGQHLSVRRRKLKAASESPPAGQPAASAVPLTEEDAA